MNAPTRLLIVEDHPIFREGLLRVLGRGGPYVVAGEAGDLETGLRLARELRPEVILTDLKLGTQSGVELARALRRENHPARIIMLTMHAEESLFREAMDAGVHGYILKDNLTGELLDCLRAVQAGEVFLSPKVSAYLVRWRDASLRLQQTVSGLTTLTRMEREVLRRVAASKTSRDIARELFISEATVNTHRRNICCKLDLHGPNRLLQFALSHSAEL